MIDWSLTSAHPTRLWFRSGRLNGFSGHDQMLAVGLYGGHLAQAAELLAYAKPSWALKGRAQTMFRQACDPLLCCCYI